MLPGPLPEPIVALQRRRSPGGAHESVREAPETDSCDGRRREAKQGQNYPEKGCNIMSGGKCTECSASKGLAWAKSGFLGCNIILRYCGTVLDGRPANIDFGEFRGLS